MNAKMFAEAKAAGLVTVAKLTEDTVVVSCPQFNPATGQPVDPVYEQFSLKELERQVQASRDALAALEDFLSTLKNAPMVAKVGG